MSRHRSEAHGGRARRAGGFDHPPLGETRRAAPRSSRPAHQMGVHFRRDPPRGRAPGWSCLGAPPRDGRPSGRDQPGRRSRRARRIEARSGRMAHSAKLAVPAKITRLAPPPRSPELNPVENVCRFMRENRLSTRVLKSREDIAALRRDARNNLIDRPRKIISIGMRKWAQGGWSPRAGMGPCDRWKGRVRDPSPLAANSPCFPHV